MTKEKKYYFEYICTGLSLLIGLMVMLSISVSHGQASLPVPMPQSFKGEYSYDNITWETLEDPADINSIEEDLYLRGHFERATPDNTSIMFFKNHIGITMYVNDVLVYKDTLSEITDRGMALMPALCGQSWGTINVGGIETDDSIFIRLVNPHKAGNERAYTELLSTLCGVSSGYGFLLEECIEPYGTPFRLMGGFLLVAAVMMLGGYIAGRILRTRMAEKLLLFGLMTLFMGGYVYFDTIDMSFKNEILVFNTYIMYICMMFALFFLNLYICDMFSGLKLQLGKTAVFVSFSVNSILMMISYAGKTSIYNTLPYWLLSQIVVCVMISVLCAHSLIVKEKAHQLEFIFAILLYGSILLDASGLFYSIVYRRIFSKIVFMIFFFVHIIIVSRSLIRNQRAADRAEKLENELENSRISLMLSQIRPHFLYNALGTIRGLCRENPEQAWISIGDFAGYLRGNMNALSNSEYIHFTAELRHIQAYLRLEQVRMGDRLTVDYDIEEKNFYIPPLTVQPLVENAVKHGLFDRQDAGSVILRSWRSDGKIYISVTDDGVGFDASGKRDDYEEHNHIGLDNVRRRLEKMCGGELEIESAAGEGTTVTVIIPAEMEVNPNADKN